MLTQGKSIEGVSWTESIQFVFRSLHVCGDSLMVTVSNPQISALLPNHVGPVGSGLRGVGVALHTAWVHPFTAHCLDSSLHCALPGLIPSLHTAWIHPFTARCLDSSLHCALPGFIPSLCIAWIHPFMAKGANPKAPATITFSVLWECCTTVEYVCKWKSIEIKKDTF